MLVCFGLDISLYSMDIETNYSLLIQFDNKLHVSLKLVCGSAQKGWQDATNHTCLIQLSASVTLANSW